MTKIDFGGFPTCACALDPGQASQAGGARFASSIIKQAAIEVWGRGHKKDFRPIPRTTL